MMMMMSTLLDLIHNNSVDDREIAQACTKSDIEWVTWHDNNNSTSSISIASLDVHVHSDLFLFILIHYHFFQHHILLRVLAIR